MEISDGRLRAFVREELDRRDAERHSRCLHLEGTIPPGCDVNTVQCNACGKILTSEDYEAPGPGQPASAFMERHHMGGN